MLKSFLLPAVVSTLLVGPAWGQSDAYVEEIQVHRAEMDQEFRDPAHTPLKGHDRGHFQGLDYFEADQEYKVEAKFKRTPKAKVFKMTTSSGQLRDYVKYGEAEFKLKGKKYKLALYQNLALKDHPEHGKFLFLPFNDHTNGSETYGGGRYLDIEIPEGNTVEIDFNKCYNPYCAYSDGWSCPIPPDENKLDVAIPAGVKKYTHAH